MCCVEQLLSSAAGTTLSTEWKHPRGVRRTRGWGDHRRTATAVHVHTCNVVGVDGVAAVYMVRVRLQHPKQQRRRRLASASQCESTTRPAESVLADAPACVRGSHRRHHCHRHEGVGRCEVSAAVVKEDHCSASSHLGQTAQQWAYSASDPARCKPCCSCLLTCFGLTTIFAHVFSGYIII